MAGNHSGEKAYRSNSDNIRISLLSETSEDVRGGLHVLNNVFGDKHFDEGYWNWKYRLNPFGPSILVGAKQNDEMVGFRAFWRWMLWYQGKEIDAFQPCDTAVDMNFRRHGLFTRMTREALKISESNGIGLLFNNPNAEAKLGYLKMGWEDWGGLRWYVKPTKWSKVVTNVIRWRGSIPSCQWVTPNVEWKDESDGKRIESLVDKCKEAFPNVLWSSRSKGFYKWRYQLAPHRSYNVITWPEEVGYRACLIYGVALRGSLREVQLLDVVLDPAAYGAMDPAITKLITLESPDLITFCTTRGFPLLRELKNSGFLRIPRYANLVGKLQGSSQLSCFDPSKLGLVLGDLDTF
jgi:hypothetical protein